MTPYMYMYICTYMYMYIYSIQTHPHILTHLHVHVHCICTLLLIHALTHTFFPPPPLSPSLSPSVPLPLYFPLSLSNQSNQIYQKTMSQKRVRSFARSSSQCSGSTPSPTAWRSSTRPWRTCAHTKWPPSSTPTCAWSVRDTWDLSYRPSNSIHQDICSYDECMMYCMRYEFHFNIYMYMYFTDMV